MSGTLHRPYVRIVTDPSGDRVFTDVFVDGASWPVFGYTVTQDPRAPRQRITLDIEADVVIEHRRAAAHYAIPREADEHEPGVVPAEG